ncbi:MAG: hypothetical protein LBL16_00315 [Endomicrobium sp.]|jgi:hypothetical protein|nr:hypothetical protein [Endomicrobium sp.]
MKKFSIGVFCFYIAFVCPCLCFADEDKCKEWREQINIIGDNYSATLTQSNSEAKFGLLDSLERSAKLYKNLIEVNCNNGVDWTISFIVIDSVVGIIYAFFQTAEVIRTWKNA